MRTLGHVWSFLALLFFKAFGEYIVDFFWAAAKERFPDGRLLCNGTDACLGGTNTSGELEFRSSSDYLDCRGCLWMDLNEGFRFEFCIGFL